ncbi:hypothetical protein J4418_03530 [Candidatus Woesearchaeota archaeon]|nr:hypothetical protein [Candidatus Woesearchaeota archaeon]
MQFKNAWHILEEDETFINWKKKHPVAIFSYAFTTLDKEIMEDWQIGFYDPEEDKITTFSLMNQKIVDNRTDEVFKEPGSRINPVEMNKVKLTVNEILVIVDSFLRKEYSGEVVNKKIMILQNLPEFGTIWNITAISFNFNSVNLKVDAETGRVKVHKLTSLKEMFSKDSLL